MNRKYKLSERDYIDLYPYASPKEIKSEFGERSVSSRQIRRIYQKHNLEPSTKALENFIDKSFAVADLSVSEADWAAYTREQVELRKQKQKQSIWKRAEFYENKLQGLEDIK